MGVLGPVVPCTFPIWRTIFSRYIFGKKRLFSTIKRLWCFCCQSTINPERFHPTHRSILSITFWPFKKRKSICLLSIKIRHLQPVLGELIWLNSKLSIVQNTTGKAEKWKGNMFLLVIGFLIHNYIPAFAGCALSVFVNFPGEAKRQDNYSNVYLKKWCNSWKC